MPVRRRRDSAPDAWWISFYDSSGKRHQLTRRAPNKRAAQALERALRDEAEARLRARAGGGATVLEAFARYWREHGQFLASKHAERGYMNRWADALGEDTPLSEITAERIAEAIAGWRLPPGGKLDTHRPKRDRRWVTDSTINHRLSFLQRLWGRAEDVWGWALPRIPWRRLKLPEPTELPDRSIPRDTLRSLLRVLNPRSRPIVMAARISGLRRGALLRLDVRDFDWQHEIIRAVSKGRAGGKITPVPITRAWLWVLHRNGPVEVGRVFRVSAHDLRKDWEEARRAIGRPDLVFKDLRHSFAQALEDAELGDVITDALHHSDPRLRRRYAKARIERVRKAVEMATVLATAGKKSRRSAG